MPLQTNDVMQLLVTLAQEENIKVTVTQSLRGGLLAGVGAFAGGLIGGPVGMAIGASVGGIAGAATSQEFQPLYVVIKQLPAPQKQELEKRVMNIISGFEPQDALALLALVHGSAAIKVKIISAMTDFFTSSLGYQIQN
uniref:Uncharacterized protein n=1 Tax=Ciona savignyi TaxID=51511 RepID=H2YNG2_CIOSA